MSWSSQFYWITHLPNEFCCKEILQTTRVTHKILLKREKEESIWSQEEIEEKEKLKRKRNWREIEWIKRVSRRVCSYRFVRRRLPRKRERRDKTYILFFNKKRCFNAISRFRLFDGNPYYSMAIHISWW